LEVKLKSAQNLENSEQKPYYLYLIESGNYFKFGITQDLIKRFRQYTSHNPNVNLISIVEGTEEDIRITESVYIAHLNESGNRRINDWFLKTTTPIGGIPIFESIMKVEKNRSDGDRSILLKEPLHLQYIVECELKFNHFKDY
jgi:hypothetical protein